MAAQDRLLTLGKNLLFLSHPSAKLGRNYPSIVNGPSTDVTIKCKEIQSNSSTFPFLALKAPPGSNCHNVILYPDLTLSYAGKWDLPFPWPWEIWVRNWQQCCAINYIGYRIPQSFPMRKESLQSSTITIDFHLFNISSVSWSIPNTCTVHLWMVFDTL